MSVPCHKSFSERHPSGKYLKGDMDTDSLMKDAVPLQVADLIIWGFYRLASVNDAVDKVTWWADRLDGLVRIGDAFCLLSPEQAERIYAEIRTLCS